MTDKKIKLLRLSKILHNYYLAYLVAIVVTYKRINLDMQNLNWYFYNNLSFKIY